MFVKLAKLEAILGANHFDLDSPVEGPFLRRVAWHCFDDSGDESPARGCEAVAMRGVPPPDLWGFWYVCPKHAGLPDDALKNTPRTPVESAAVSLPAGPVQLQTLDDVLEGVHFDLDRYFGESQGDGSVAFRFGDADGPSRVGWDCFDDYLATRGCEAAPAANDLWTLTYICPNHASKGPEAMGPG